MVEVLVLFPKASDPVLLGLILIFELLLVIISNTPEDVISIPPDDFNCKASIAIPFEFKINLDPFPVFDKVKLHPSVLFLIFQLPELLLKFNMFVLSSLNIIFPPLASKIISPSVSKVKSPLPKTFIFDFST